jgi:aspartyl-tRNA(Asn)/glutamyl-tRNA(Gln) amidotransferase subunit A
MAEGLDPEVKQAVISAIEQLKRAGAEVTEISMPSLPVALAVYYIICPAEVSSNLSRYDGQRFGLSTPDASSLEEKAKRRIMIGTYVLSSGYYDAYYKKAQTVRTKLINEFETAFKHVDFLIGPTAPSTAFKIGENVNDPLKMYLSDIMTVSANLSGVPAISLPAGTHEGLPIGLQLMGPQRADRALLGFAQQVEALL